MITLRENYAVTRVTDSRPGKSSASPTRWWRRALVKLPAGEPGRRGRRRRRLAAAGSLPHCYRVWRA